MKKITKILIALGIGIILSGIILWNWKSPSPTLVSPTPTNMVDTTKYTDVVLINRTNDSVQVFVTLPSTQSIVGKFGMDSTNFNPNAFNPDGTPVHCKGIFWAQKNVEYHLGVTSAVYSYVISWGVDNVACTVAQKMKDSKDKQLYPYGFNIFEFTVNTWWQDGKVTGSNEAADISCVDGLHCVLKQTVTSFGPRNSDGLNPNFGAFWDFGYTDSSGDLTKYKTSTNGINFLNCINIPGVFPYGCDKGYISANPPTPCTEPYYPVTCSTKWGDINSSQINRQGQGGQLICEFLGFTNNPQPGIK